MHDPEKAFNIPNFSIFYYLKKKHDIVWRQEVLQNIKFPHVFFHVNKYYIGISSLVEENRKWPCFYYLPENQNEHVHMYICLFIFSLKQQFPVFALFFSPTCLKAKFRKCSIYSNRFFQNFHLYKSNFTCPEHRTSGLAGMWVSAKTEFLWSTD